MDEVWERYRRNTKGWRRDELARVHPRIMVGPAFMSYHSIFEKHGITHVINCASDDMGALWFKKEFSNRYVCIDAVDGLSENIVMWYPKFQKTMTLFLSDPDCKSVYVHCECGINRSAFLTLIYVCVKMGFQLEMAIKNMTIQRPCMFSNLQFRKQVVDYIKNPVKE